jgi:hypothetical protein
MEPEIFKQIILYSGNVERNINKKFIKTLNLEKLLSIWFTEIHVQYKIKDLILSELHVLWHLYQKRIDGAPNRLLLNKIISLNLINSDIFYSTHYKTPYLLKHINPVNCNIRVGDTINTIDDNYNKQIYIRSFKSFVKLNKTLPEDIIINNYPITDYFIKSNITEVYFDTSDTNVKLLNIYQNSIFEYITTGKSTGYKIWTARKDFVSNFKGIMTFNNTSFLFIKYKIRTQKDELSNKIYNDPYSRVLFDNKIFSDSEF